MKKHQRLSFSKPCVFKKAFMALAFSIGGLSTAHAQADVTPPVARCQNYTMTVNCGQTTLDVSKIDNGSTDNVGVASMTVSPNSFTCSQAGIQTVTLTVKDAAGNTSTCTSTVTVLCSPVTCSINVTPCAGPADEPLTGPNSQPGSHYSSSNPFIMYLGYGPQCVVLDGRGRGTNVFYFNCWAEDAANPASGTLSCYNCGISTDPTFTPTKSGIYKFTYTSFGSPNSNNFCTPSLCAAVCTITICVKDINDIDGDGDGDEDRKNKQSDKKVYVCHVPMGNPANVHTIHISKNAAPAHIGRHGGCYYGPCESPCVANNRKGSKKQVTPIPELFEEGTLELTLYPNPSTSAFNITIESAEFPTADIRVYDLTGRIVESLPNQAAGVNVTVGANLVPGSYIIQVQQGGESKKIKVNKL